MILAHGHPGDYALLYSEHDRSLDAIDNAGDCLAPKSNMGHVKPYCVAKKEHTRIERHKTHISHCQNLYSIQYPPLGIPTTVLYRN